MLKKRRRLAMSPKSRGCSARRANRFEVREKRSALTRVRKQVEDGAATNARLEHHVALTEVDALHGAEDPLEVIAAEVREEACAPHCGRKVHRLLLRPRLGRHVAHLRSAGGSFVLGAADG